MADLSKQPDDTSTRTEAKPRSELQGMARFMREMGWALAMALVFIVYVIQAFKIPTGSMENSLLIGDFLLGLKFIYGSPLLPLQDKLGINARFPGLTDPKSGDVIIFKFPGLDRKDYIKRCVAGPGQTLRIEQKKLIVDGDTLKIPPHGLYLNEGLFPNPLRRVEWVRREAVVSGQDTFPIAPGAAVGRDTVIMLPYRVVKLDNGDSVICQPGKPCMRADRIVAIGEHVIDDRLTYFAPLRIPARGDTIIPATLPLREFIFFRHLVWQELPRAQIRTVAQLYVDGTFANERLVRVPWFADRIKFGDIPWDRIDNWTRIDDAVSLVRSEFPDASVEVRWVLEIDGTRVDSYVVKKDNYFMMGDNRDNSLDSRYWGYLNRNFIKAKAFILYFSLNSETPYILLPLKIRWNRIGKLIRAWKG